MERTGRETYDDDSPVIIRNEKKKKKKGNPYEVIHQICNGNVVIDILKLQLNPFFYSASNKIFLIFPVKHWMLCKFSFLNFDYNVMHNVPVKSIMN